MSEEKPKYSDLEDGIDYRIIKSYGRATRTPIRKSLVYALVVVTIVRTVFILLNGLCSKTLSHCG